MHGIPGTRRGGAFAPPILAVSSRRRSLRKATGSAAMPSAIEPLATRARGLTSATTTTKPKTRPNPKINRAILV
jgi:hypothetical protein